MNEIVETEERREIAWIKTYMDILGASETQARGVFMCEGCQEPPDGECTPAPSIPTVQFS